MIGVRIALLAASLTFSTVVDPATYQAVRYRLLGPSRGGRSTAVTHECSPSRLSRWISASS